MKEPNVKSPRNIPKVTQLKNNSLKFNLNIKEQNQYLSPGLGTLKVSALNHFHWIPRQNLRTASFTGMFQSRQMPIFSISEVNNNCTEKRNEHIM